MSFSPTSKPESLVPLKAGRATGPKNSWAAAMPPCNSPVELPPDGSCIHNLFEQQVRRTPHAVAVITENTKFTYQQLNRQANRLAYQLSALGVGPDQLVGICVERSLDMVIGLLGILKAGGAYVPIDPNYPTERIEFILQDTQVQVLLSQTHLEDKMFSCLASKNTTVICLDRDQWTNMQSCPDLAIPVTPNHLMYVIYTSGSTGHPKGVMIPHSGICNQLHWRQTTFPLTDQDRVLQNISFSFDPSVWQIFWPLLIGAQLVLPKPGGRQDITYLVKLIEQQAVSVIALVPSLLRVILEHSRLDRCQSLKHIFCGGEELPLKLQQQFFKSSSTGSIHLHNVYGPTEASIDATYWTCQPSTNYSTAPIGNPIANTQIHILDSELVPLPAGEIGEIYIEGYGLARGYLNRPELTATKFVTYPYNQSRIYRTGDLGKYLPDGSIQFLGRVDQQVKIRGFRIELGEVESCLNQHPAIQQSAVTAQDFALGQKRLLAYFIPQSDNIAPDSKTLQSWLKQRLPDYMVPAVFTALTNFPLNANGKLDRKALPAPAFEESRISNENISFQNDWEIKLSSLWCRVLQLPSVIPSDNFFDLGGDSLLAAQLSNQIEQIFHHPFPIASFFKAPTLTQMAALLKENTGLNTEQVVVPIKSAGNKPPLFCFHTKTGSIFDYYGLAKYWSADQPVYGVQSPGFHQQKPCGELAGSQLFNEKASVKQERLETMAAIYIKEIQTLQPQGPYHLCGYSFGGLLAYEVAQQLVDQGQTVEVLALFDTYNYPGQWFYEPLSLRLQNATNKLQTLSWTERFTYTYHKLQHTGQAVQEYIKSKQRSQPEKLSLQEQICETALKHYRAKPYKGNIILFRAEQTPEPFGYRSIERDASLGWDKVVTGDIITTTVPCHHFILMHEPHIKTLAQRLSSYVSSTQNNG